MKLTAPVTLIVLLLVGGQELATWPWAGIAAVQRAGVMPSLVDALMQSIWAGFQHIIPDGLDHVAFLLGLFFLSRNLPTLLLQATLFTLAHSLTLGIVATTGLSVPAQWVEVAVALSIATVAAENFFPRRFRRLRSWMIAGFGCIHGLAFAHNLVLAPQMKWDPMAALFGFNLGVEFGQLAVIGIAWLVFHPWWSRSWYERRIALPASCAIALSGLIWALHRGLSGA